MKKQNKIKFRISILLLIILVIITPKVNAHLVNIIEINKTAPKEINFDEILEVKISVLSNYNESLMVKLKEIVDFGEPLDKENLIKPQNITEKENETIINDVRWLKPDGKCDIGCKSGDNICEIDCNDSGDSDRIRASQPSASISKAVSLL